MSESPLNAIAEHALGSGVTPSQAVNDDLVAVIVLASLLRLAVVEYERPFLRPGMKVVKTSYLTNLSIFLFNDITLSILSVPTLYNDRHARPAVWREFDPYNRLLRRLTAKPTALILSRRSRKPASFDPHTTV